MSDTRQEQWPQPEVAAQPLPHMFFILTLPYSGSTALATLLNTSHRTMLLNRNGEGQWLLPGLSAGDRWNPEKHVDYKAVAATWTHKFQAVRHLVGNVDVVIEKSPPNLVRIDALIDLFESVSLMANNRDPYASCSSILYRVHDAEQLSPEERSRVLIKQVGDWIGRSRLLMETAERLGIPLVTYEAFCADPGVLRGLLDLPSGVIESIDWSAEVSVKDYPAQRIIDQNPRQLQRLAPGEIALLNRELAGHGDLLAYFGYRLRDNESAQATRAGC